MSPTASRFSSALLLLSVAASAAARHDPDASDASRQVPLSQAGLEGLSQSVDFDKLFNDRVDDRPGKPSWSRDRWSGLVSFASSPPLRCWGDDADIAYDVAVIGTSSCCVSSWGFAQDASRGAV
jgi:hypothetical protein